MLNKIRVSNLEINLDNLAYNIRILREYIDKKVLIMAVVKANAYGHGAVHSSKIFLENGADRLGVSILSEGIELRKAGIEAPILILNYTNPSQYKNILQYNLIQNIFSYRDAKKLSDVALGLNKKATIHIKIDTGMGRIGFCTNDKTVDEIIKISKLPNIEIEGIFTHFAKSDESNKNFTKIQFKKFMDLVQKIEAKGLHIKIKHVSNSAATIDLGIYNLDMIRPGLILYGHYPSNEVIKNNLKIIPAMTLKSKISHIKTVSKGSGIGYGHMYVAEERTKIATLPIGYADGYSRILTGKASVYIKGKRARVIGKICMDQIMIDVTDIKNVRIGDNVILFGYESKEPSVEEIADWIGTINYEVLCMISKRVPRVYIQL